MAVRTLRDVVFGAATECADRFRGGEVDARRITAILDATWLALGRHDDAELDRLERWAVRYSRERTGEETWGPHAAWGGNAAKVRIFVGRATSFLESDKPERLAVTLQSLWPHLGNIRTRDWEELKMALTNAASKAGGDPRRFAERALVVAGMPPKQANQLFAFMRVASSRKVRNARKKPR